MNRPNKKDDPNYPWEFPDTYLGELEEYCDELEKTLDIASHGLWVAEGMLYKTHSKTKEEWKEWLMKDG